MSVHAEDPLPDMLADAGLPTVLLGRRSEEEQVTYVDADNAGGARGTPSISGSWQLAGDGPELSGVDLARVALHQAREAARKRGESEARAPRRGRTRVVQRNGRERCRPGSPPCSRA